MGEVRSRQLKFLCHIILENGLEKLLLAGGVEGRRARAMQRVKYMDSLVADVREVTSAVQLMRLAADRERWRFMVAHVKQDIPGNKLMQNKG